ncbi:MAG: hypothetical protein K2G23_10535, partial [Muribaculaceae bacterium]|nr:hypothetical protein [Muribaculaceae bacterium]
SQYTRLGISSKDDCFAELIFEGNDNETYVSKFSLGIARTGKLRPPAWRLQIGEREIIEGNKKDEIKAKIEKAVGLSYDQFCRMAMLAQGQFANFLTGGKDEREKILEQLTSTQHFSRYGEAIERIYKRAKQDKEQAENIFDAEKGHILKEEEETQTSERLAQLEKGVEDIRKHLGDKAYLLSLLSNLEVHEKEIREIQESILNLTAKAGSEDVKSKQDVILKWDATSSEREWLRKKNEASLSLNKNVSLYLTSLSRLDLLSADLNDREIALAVKKSQHRKIEEDIKVYDIFKDIHSNIALIEEKFNQRDRSMEDLREKNETLDKGRQATQSLNNKLKDAEEEAEKTAALVKDKKDSIERLNAVPAK